MERQDLPERFTYLQAALAICHGIGQPISAYRKPRERLALYAALEIAREHVVLLEDANRQCRIANQHVPADAPNRLREDQFETFDRIAADIRKALRNANQIFGIPDQPQDPDSQDAIKWHRHRVYVTAADQGIQFLIDMEQDNALDEIGRRHLAERIGAILQRCKEAIDFITNHRPPQAAERPHQTRSQIHDAKDQFSNARRKAAQMGVPAIGPESGVRPP